jgi:predicted phage terminase large subunit-like protein
LTTASPDAAQLTLSRTQSAFVLDTHRYAAFVGGIGSGKSYAGAAKALVQEIGRPSLGLVLAPTYPMLRDATWRTALEVWAPVIVEVVRHEMRMTLRGGTDVLFRSADDPERLRGPNAAWAWIDEGSLCPSQTWPIVIGRLRQDGRVGRCWVTFTPKGAQNWTYPVFAAADAADVALYRASTHANPFLDPEFVTGLERQYTNRFARQELAGEFLTDIPGAMWTRADLDGHRVTVAPDMARIVVAIDPAVTSGEQADETGIVVAGKGVDGHGYVLADLTCRLSPDGWARRAVNAYHEWQADRLIAETNNGGELVKQTIHTVDRHVAYRAVTATRGKRVRAEPIAALYEQGMVHHVGTLPALEDQMTAFVPDNYDGSPDRVDALVWALTDLLVTGAGPWRAI